MGCPLVAAMHQTERDPAVDETQQNLANQELPQPFAHHWRPETGWSLRAIQGRTADLERSVLLTETAWYDLAEAPLERLCNTGDQALSSASTKAGPTSMGLAHLGASSDGRGEQED